MQFNLQQFAAAAAAQERQMRLAESVVVLDGRPNQQAAQELREALLAPYIDQYEELGFDGRALLEDYASTSAAARVGGGFRFSEIERSLREANATAEAGTRTREAITTSQMASTINLTVTHDIYDDYADWPAVWRDLCEVVNSNSVDEIYPEEWQDDMPVAVAETEPAPESRVVGANIRIRNYEYARELVISKRLFDRDKVGRAKRAAQRFGRRYIQAMDKAFVLGFFKAGALTNLNTLPNGTIPKTNLAGQSGIAGFNPSGAGPITPQRLEDALTAPAFFVDPFNYEIVVDFDTVFVDSFDRLKTLRYLNSQYTSVQTAYAPGGDTVGQTAGAFSENVLRGQLKIAFSPYVKKARNPLAGAGNGFPWATLEAGADSGAIMQVVHELEIEQEAPNAGKSHEERSYRWQGTVEFGTGVRNARLIYFGN